MGFYCCLSYSRGTGICYYGNEAISLFRKFQSPVVFEGKCNNYDRAVIQMPYDENSRIRMQEMVQRWMKILGYNNGSVYLSPNGSWGFRNRENYIDNKQKAWNIISLMAIFAQAIYKTLRIGYTSPLVMYFEMELFSSFEIESILNLINSICSEHSINAIMISDIENVDTKLRKIVIPDSSLYT